ncbi:hypothetical protein [Paraglaciecola sp. 2405UD69-4]|uniref:hypothetical protein n=1 Tax=Paraglaciecola sp. 2405UD69-4 TaxID=3391836 RepID=UPI0039C9458B
MTHSSRNEMDTSDTIKGLVKRIQKRLVIQRALQSLAVILLIWACFYLSIGANYLVYIALTCSFILLCWQVTKTAKYKAVSADSLLQHLNREFPECEESAHLVIAPQAALTLLQRLQSKRITPKVQSILAKDLSAHLPQYPATLAIAVIIITLLLTLTLKLVDIESSQNTPQRQKQVDNIHKTPKAVTIEQVLISIEPPRYTRLAKRDVSDFNLEIVTGSKVSWQLILSNPPKDSPLAIMLGEQVIPLIEDEQGNYLASALIDTTSVYFVSDNHTAISDIYTIAVTPDSAPQIRFIEPTQTITEIPNNATPKFVTKVEIYDDFGLEKVEILASIASGSGESVKFRDQTFAFDSQRDNQGKSEFLKEWDLSALKMQPGDELYFSVRAFDNRQKNSLPAPQLSRSANKIVRWLEDEEEGIQSDGILLDFVPEYFKSQRQIIIETQELIANKANMENTDFIETSRDLGVAQSALKKKYGQFLGDEFESGTLHTMESWPSHHHEENEKSKALAHPLLEAHAKQDEHEEALRTESASHEHDNSELDATEDDKSGYSQVIAQFGHAHGASDDGNFVKKGIPSPITLMKNSIANMWQAELHLQLAEPEKALPYENLALEFLNRAKKAERIYVKRLGFEPPPVSEKRRYEGKLSKILSYQRNEQIEISKPKVDAMKRLLVLLNHTSTTSVTPINAKQLEDIALIKGHFSEQLDTSPTDIAFIATLEKMNLAKALPLSNCEQCLKTLAAKLWQALPQATAEPANQLTHYSIANPSLKKYAEFLQLNQQGMTP